MDLEIHILVLAIVREIYKIGLKILCLIKRIEMLDLDNEQR